MEASLAGFGAEATALEGMITQVSQLGSLRVATMPEALRLRQPYYPPGVREEEQVVRVTVSIE